MIRISLEADTAAELKAAVQELAGIGAPTPSLGPLQLPPLPLTLAVPGLAALETSTWYGGSQPSQMRYLDIRYAADHPDHLMVELRVGNMRADGCFAVCWHKALPHVRKLVQSTNIFFRCKRIRLMEDSRWQNPRKPRTPKKLTTSSRTKKRGGSRK